jgi:hypothetical protein
MDYSAEPLLQIAINADYYLLVKFLISSCCNQQDNLGVTPLHCAVWAIMRRASCYYVISEPFS